MTAPENGGEYDEVVTPYPPSGVPFVASSDTSAEAAASIEDDMNRLEAIVYGQIAARADEGATDDELEQLTGLSHQTVSARRRTLVLRGCVSDTGRRRLTRSKRRAAVWVASGDGISDLGAGGSARPPRPSASEAAEALLELRRCLAVAMKHGFRPSAAFTKFGKWLAHLVTTDQW